MKDIFLKLMFNMENMFNTTKNVRKHRDIKLVTTEKIRNYSLVSEPSYGTTNFFT